jgi:hypothetical protein
LNDGPIKTRREESRDIEKALGTFWHKSHSRTSIFSSACLGKHVIEGKRRRPEAMVSDHVSFREVS